MNNLSGIKKRSLMFAAVAVVGGTSLASGLVAPQVYASSYSTDSSSEQMMVGNPYSQAGINLRVNMNNLLREHVTTSLSATRAIVSHDSQASIDAATAAQYANSDDLSAVIGSVYGSAAQEQFSELFKGHIEISNAYAMAVAHGDDSGKQAAYNELQTYLHELADFFSGAIPGLPAQDVYGMLAQHEKLINESTDAYAGHDYVQSYQIERIALTQISGAADALATGVIATQPVKFQ